MTTASFALRRATRADATGLVRLIRGLAAYEKLPPPDAEAEARLVEHGFGEHPRFETWLAFGPGAPEPVAYAIFFETYSTFLARPSLYLEDLFVSPEYRGQGIGSALLRQCVALAHERGCGRVEWTCLDWNSSAQAVYETRVGAKKMAEWLLYRLTRPEMEKYLRSFNPDLRDESESGRIRPNEPSL
jgi:GNAT superfamily N-acetyltransferase